MKNKRFIQAMNEIDDSLLTRYEAVEQKMSRQKAHKSIWIRWGSVAACLCIIFTSVFFLQRKNGNNAVPSIDVGGSEKITQTGTTGGYIADEFPMPPPPIFETKSADEYESFAQSKELPFTLFPISAFECFGTFNGFETYGIDSHSDFDLKYLYQFEQMFAGVNVVSKGTYYSKEKYLRLFGDIYIEAEDMPENLYMNPQLYWFRHSEDERVFEAYIEKYKIDDRYVHFKVTENVVLRYREWEDIPRVIFWFDDYVMELSFGPEYSIMEEYDLVGVTPTVKDLLTKSTAQKTAEELYALWKDALK